MKTAKLILIATMIMPMSANAGFNVFINGHKLHDKSTAYKSGDIDNADLYDAGAYVYYVMGVIDVTIGSGLFCPQNITSDQAANVVSKYLNEHPESWDSSGEALVKAALAKEWPCQK
ncbi:MAG: Rap1a/Tai family immunity protein [Methylobacter sp.]